VPPNLLVHQKKAVSPKVPQVVKIAKPSRKKQIQDLVENGEEDKENKGNVEPGLFIQGTLTGPPLSLVSYNVFKYCL
jgi:hypothetical protein